MTDQLPVAPEEITWPAPFAAIPGLRCLAFDARIWPAAPALYFWTAKHRSAATTIALVETHHYQ